MKVNPPILQEFARLTACRARRFLEEIDGLPDSLPSSGTFTRRALHGLPLLAVKSPSDLRPALQIHLPTDYHRNMSGELSILRMSQP